MCAFWGWTKKQPNRCMFRQWTWSYTKQPNHQHCPSLCNTTKLHVQKSTCQLNKIRAQHKNHTLWDGTFNSFSHIQILVVWTVSGSKKKHSGNTHVHQMSACCFGSVCPLDKNSRQSCVWKRAHPSIFDYNVCHPRMQYAYWTCDARHDMGDVPLVFVWSPGSTGFNTKPPPVNAGQQSSILLIMISFFDNSFVQLLLRQSRVIVNSMWKSSVNTEYREKFSDVGPSRIQNISALIQGHSPCPKGRELCQLINVKLYRCTG